MNSLTMSTCMASNMDNFCFELSDYISKRLSIPVQFINDIPWQERERLLDEGKVDLCWICGLPYVWKADQIAPRIEPLAAPVMQGRRYRNRPVYYSDVVVRSESPFKELADLRGRSWAYNEPGSHSGYNVVRYHLAIRGEVSGFFGRVVESGAHQISLQMILRGEVDGSAIDSTVLALELLSDPSIEAQIRIIDTFGPSPIPVWVTSKNTPLELRTALLELFSRMDQDPSGRELLKHARMRRFAPVSDSDYDPIREMARKAEGVRLGRS